MQIPVPLMLLAQGMWHLHNLHICGCNVGVHMLWCAMPYTWYLDASASYDVSCLYSSSRSWWSWHDVMSRSLYDDVKSRSNSGNMIYMKSSWVIWILYHDLDEMSTRKSSWKNTNKNTKISNRSRLDYNTKHARSQHEWNTKISKSFMCGFTKKSPLWLDRVIASWYAR